MKKLFKKITKVTDKAHLRVLSVFLFYKSILENITIFYHGEVIYINKFNIINRQIIQVYVEG